MSDFIEVFKNKEFRRVSETVAKEKDPSILVLRAHLYTENILERILTNSLPRGDKLAEHGSNLSYYHKLLIVDSLDRVDDQTISSLRNLNKLRNACVHQLDRDITFSDVTQIGSPLGKTFTRIKRDQKLDEVKVLRGVIMYILGRLLRHCHSAEYDYTHEPAEKKKRSRSSSSTVASRK